MGMGTAEAKLEREEKLLPCEVEEGVGQGQGETGE